MRKLITPVFAFLLACTGHSQTVEEAIDAYISGIQKGDTSVVWDAIPASYQQRVTALVKQFALKADEDLYNRWHDLIGDVGEILDRKQDLLIATAKQYGAKVPNETPRMMSAASDILKVLGNSRFSRLANLANPDLGAMSTEVGNKIMGIVMAIDCKSPHCGTTPKEMLEKLSDLDVDVLSESDEAAKVKVGMEGLGSHTIDLVKVEGKWMAAHDAKNWERGLKLAEKVIAQWNPNADDLVAMRKSMDEGMGLVEDIVDAISNATTSDELVEDTFAAGMKLMNFMQREGKKQRGHWRGKGHRGKRPPPGEAL